MKKITKILIGTAIGAGLFAGAFLAASAVTCTTTYPAAYDNYTTGGCIASSWANALEQAIGLTTSTNTTSTFGQINNLQTAPGSGQIASSAISWVNYGTASSPSSTWFKVANNLSEGTPSTMRTNLGLGDSATLPSSTWAKVANNLSDLTSTSSARSNLGYASGTNINVNNGSGVIGLTGQVAVANGGTGTSTAPSDAQYLGANGSTPTWKSIVAGNNIIITSSTTSTIIAAATQNTAAGSNQDVQFNSNGTFGVDTGNFDYVTSTHQLTLGNLFNTNGTTFTVLVTSTVFSETGAVASYTIPTAPAYPARSTATSYYAVVNVQGAAGGNETSGSAGVGGFGGSATGTLSAASSTAGTVYYFNVGGVGGNQNGTTGGSGGYNGGGTGGGASSWAGAGGGGMTWFSATSTFSTSSVILVGGGGGGACANSGSNFNGANAGGTTGSGGCQIVAPGAGGGGTQTGGGAAGTGGNNNGTAGGAGQGGNGGAGGNVGGSGAGAGYYGGGGGGGGTDGSTASGGGGGGSSFMSSALTSTSTAALSAGTNGTGTISMYETYTIPNVYLATSTLMYGGHAVAGGPAPTIPNGTVNGNDNAGRVTVSSSTTSYVLTFGQSWGNAPACFASVASGTAAYFSLINASTTQATFTSNTALATTSIFQYHCIGF